MINVIKNIKKVCCIIIWLSSLVHAKNSNEIAVSIDFSVYNGQGSILLHWSIPETIKGKNTNIYSQKFGEKEFEIFIYDSNACAKASMPVDAVSSFGIDIINSGNTNAAFGKISDCCIVPF